jgi:hypothetical protein
VTFAEDTFTITATASAGGKITGATIADPSVPDIENSSYIFTAALNENVSFTFAANSGYHVESVVVDGDFKSTTLPYDFTAVQANHYITVTFAANNTGGGGGGGSSTPKPEEPDPTPEPDPDRDLWFRDVPKSAWYYDDVRYVVNRGLFTGTTTDLFSPLDPTTRGMLVTVLYRLAGEPEVHVSSPFTDVSNNKYYASAIAWASQNGIVNGVSKTLFEPDRNISRQELAAILIRYAQYARLNLDPIRGGEHFADDAEIGKWAAAYVDELYKAGVVNGKNNNLFDPKGEALRAEVAAMLHRFLENVK